LNNRLQACPTTNFKLFGKLATCVIDTGTNLNIISKTTFNNFLFRPKLQPSFVQAFGFNAETPIPILGEFSVTLRCNYRRVRATFLVLDGHADNLLGYRAAAKLGLVEIKTDKVSQEFLNPHRIASNMTDIYHVKPSDAKLSQFMPVNQEAVPTITKINATFDPKINFADLFKPKIGQLKDIEVVIEMDPNVRPLQIPPYPIPLPLMDMTRDKIMKMGADGVIEPTEGKLSWLSPMHVVPKLDSVTKQLVGVRITSNNKALNKAIVMEKRWMPSIKTLTHELNGMTCFSKVDLKDAFNQVVIDKGSRNLTAFSTPWGVFRYCRLNMGLAIASELFQSILMDILRHIPHQQLATDDIIVYGKDYVECEKYTVMVLEALKSVEATLNEEKCIFMAKEISFFGHKISKDGIQPLECKVKDFLEMEEPRNFKELHSFLGIAGYFSSRTPYQAQDVKCLRALLNKGGMWEWQSIHKEAMDSAKNSLIKHKLAHFNPCWITELIVDAGPEGCASFLTQVDPMDPEKRVLIHCSSHAFTSAEINYSHVEKEAFACVWACIKDHLHLYGAQFNLITDNIGCQKIFEEDIVRKKIPPRIEKLKSKLAIYNAKVIFRPGLSNIADYLSRRSRKISIEKEKTAKSDVVALGVRMKAPKALPRRVKEVIRQVSNKRIENKPYKMTLAQIAVETKSDAKLSELAVSIGKYRSIKRNKNLKEFRSIFGELRNHESGVITRNDLIVMPASLQQMAVEFAHEGHLGIVLCKRLLRNRCWWPRMDRMIKDEVEACPACQANTDTTTHEPMIPNKDGRLKAGSIISGLFESYPNGGVFVGCLL
jgi:hypothetical protein